MKILSDNPTEIDYFGYEDYAETLAKVITNEVNNPPFTIGIFGEWGSGKTSLMKMIEKQVNKEPGTKTIWFNPWKYDNKEAIWSALIQSILSEMAGDEEYIKKRKKTNRKKILNNIKKIASQFAWCAAGVGTQHLTGGMIGPRIVADVKKAFKTNEEPYNFVNKFEEEFGRLTEEYTGGQGKIVVFIDDLDRCIPENAITALEAIKLYLDKSRCVFIIGADRSVIVKGIIHRYMGQIENFSGKDYLEKIIQLPFVIPSISEDTLKDRLKKKDNPLGVFVGDFKLGDGFHTLLIHGTKRNPRTIKRFINCFTVITTLAGQNKCAGASKSSEPEVLGRILLIQMRFPDFFEYVVTHNGAIREYDDVLWDSERLGGIREDLKKYYESPELKEFMEGTKGISCNDTDLVRNMTLLTKRLVRT